MSLNINQKYTSKLKNYIGALPRKQVVIVVIICIYINGCCAWDADMSCGMDQLDGKPIATGSADIETYPWMGLLVYPFGNDVVEEPKKTNVILISTQLVIATALEIDKFPKHDFRNRSRVVLGRNCTTGPFLRVLQYNLHPDYGTNYYSTVALVQIAPRIKLRLMPICPPPHNFTEVTIYAMTPTQDCSSAMIDIYEMSYVQESECRDYYRRADLDIESMWPRHVACAQGKHGGRCLWRSGTALVFKQKGQWHLLGVGVYGPGCEAPARFLDYGRYVLWVRDSIARMGRVSVTRISDGDLVVRRAMSKLQRYGPCDIEETRHNFFTDYSEVLLQPYDLYTTNGTVHYNLTLFGRIEYTCIAVRAWYTDLSYKANISSPSIKLRRWCLSTTPLCADTGSNTIFFSVTISYRSHIRYKVSCYGLPIRTVEAKRILWWVNQRKSKPHFYAWPTPWQTPEDYIDQGPFPKPDSNAYPLYKQIPRP